MVRGVGTRLRGSRSYGSSSTINDKINDRYEIEKTEEDGKV